MMYDINRILAWCQNVISGCFVGRQRRGVIPDSVFFRNQDWRFPVDGCAGLQLFVSLSGWSLHAWLLLLASLPCAVCLWCGDFNVRCDGLSDVNGEPSKCCVDLNCEELPGWILVDCMRNSGLVFVKGRNGWDQFTCISSRRRSVVDYCLVSEEELMSIFETLIQRQCHNVRKSCVGVKKGIGYLITPFSYGA